jgi:hypothetical protein
MELADEGMTLTQWGSSTPGPTRGESYSWESCYIQENTGGRMYTKHKDIDM